jgi:septum formation protein
VSRPVVLASTSAYRRAQLEQLGLRFEAVGPGVDEGPLQSSGQPPSEIARALARLKAEAVAARRPEAVVIGGDQLAELDGEVLGKPGTPEAAVRQLSRLAGRTHALHTAVAVAVGADVEVHLDTTWLTVRSLDEAALRRYVALDDPVDCAGAYKIERAGIALFERVETDDPSAITGLPLMTVVRVLERRGVRVP